MTTAERAGLILKMLSGQGGSSWLGIICEAIEAAVQEERDACAHIADMYGYGYDENDSASDAASSIESAIRGRT